MADLDLQQLVEEYPNVTGIEKLDGLFFPVSEEYIRIPVKGSMVIVEKKAIFTVDPDSQAVSLLGVFHPNYRLLEHSEAFLTLFTALRDLGISATVQDLSLSKNRARVSALIEFPDYVLFKGEPDEMMLRVYLTNSYDGSSNFVFSLAACRMICLNGMYLGFFRGALAGRHNAQLHDQLGKIRDVIFGILTEGPKALEAFYRELSTEIPPEILEKPANFYRLASDTGLGRKMTEEAHMRIRQYRSSGELQTWWDLYNIYTRVISHMSRSLSASVRHSSAFNDNLDRLMKVRRKPVVIDVDIEEAEPSEEAAPEAVPSHPAVDEVLS